MMISTSTKLFPLAVIVLLFSGLAFSSHYYDHQRSSYSITGDTGFSVPQYDSQAELATELIAPFLFLVILLKFGLEMVLSNVLDSNNAPIPGEKPDVSRESTLMALTITGMLIPTPFWDYMRLAASSIGLIATGAVILAILFVIYSFIQG
ncbi:MAG: hypothetical protein BRC29_01145 [Nanohaloarchaea archaeon SW_7_43_1]|nr:MAG: hypothetical protein BRC29_01145 [Nanohaloarchaea archaeon SW_7_43_1]